jgi:hypothetical protein
MSMKRRKIQRKKKAQPSPLGEDDLNATSDAVLDLTEKRQPETQAPADESIEDPLQDWPESSGEPDQWLDERRAGNDKERIS